MHFIIGLSIISIIYFIGFYITHFFELPLPSSILSLLLLFLGLTLKIIPVKLIKSSCTSIIYIMPLFFIPASMGLFDHFSLFKKNSFALIGSTFISSLIVFVCMAFVIDQIIQRKK